MTVEKTSREGEREGSKLALAAKQVRRLQRGGTVIAIAQLFPRPDKGRSQLACCSCVVATSPE